MNARVSLISAASGVLCFAAPAVAQRTDVRLGPQLEFTVAAMRVPATLGSSHAPMRAYAVKATSGTFWSVAGAAGGLLIGILVGESVRQGTTTEDAVTNEYNSKMATTVGLGLLVPLGAALGAAHGVSNIGSSSGKKGVVKGVAVLTAYTAAAIVIGSKIKRDDPDLTRFEPSKELLLPLPLAAVLTSLAAALVTDAATTP
jgi:hypothetical protein